MPKHTPRPPRPVALLVRRDQIPEQLRDLPQWVTWRYKWLDDRRKWDKPPRQARTGRAASSTDPKTWSAFADAVYAYEHRPNLDGIGFVVTEASAIVGVDLDHCRTPETGEIASWAWSIVQALNSYTEVSPSGTGLRIWLKARRAPNGRRKGNVEVYSWGHYLTATGWHVEGTPVTIEARQAALDAFEAEAFAQLPKAPARPATPPTNGHGPHLGDDALLDKALNARNAGKFKRLWSGDTDDYGGDDSRADLALCCELAFWTQDEAQIDRLFRRSGLYREKWERVDYRDATIAKALATTSEHYTPARPGSSTMNGNGRQTSAKTTPLLTTPLSDQYNAEALVKAHGADLRYCREWREWLHWTGHRWARQGLSEVMRRAKQTVKGFGTDLPELPDADVKAMLTHIKTSLSTARLEAMVRSAQWEPGVEIVAAALDQDPWLLNCLNGTLDLRTGELRPHQRGDLLTQQCPVRYEPDATCPRWEQFLREIFLEDEGLIAFIQRAVGYSLTGDVRERALFICHGLGRNGKSTFLEIIAELLGDYAMRTPTRTLMEKHNPDYIPNDVAALKGMRFVHASESGEGKRLDEEFIKDATGRDTLTARFMHGEWFNFRPVFKLWLRTNHKPIIRGTDPAIWDRPRLIPFNARFTGTADDKTLPDQLRQELPGILRWAVRGCLSWQINALVTPAAVRQATDDYREEMDVIGNFFADRCVSLPGLSVTSKALLAAYSQWCELNGEKPLTSKALAARLRERGYLPDKGTSGVRLWRGLGLAAPEED